MDPSKIKKSGMTSTFKPNKLAYLPPGALANRGRGKSLQSLGSVRVSAVKRTPTCKSINFNVPPSYQNERVPNTVHLGFDKTEDNVPCSQEVEVMQDAQTNQISAHESEKAKRVRGTNICNKVARLKPGEKLSITFYQNRVVGENYASFVRHLGILVRDRNMCPLRDEPDMNTQKEHVLQHMRRLWNNLRGSLHKNMKSKPFCDAPKDVHSGVDKSDWEWQVKEHFLSKTFKETSTRNSASRSKLSMPHRTGSKPFREIIYELGGKDSKPPNMDTIFFETRKNDRKLVEPETNAKYVEIQKLVQSDSSLTNIEVIEKCFGPQFKSHVV